MEINNEFKARWQEVDFYKDVLELFPKRIQQDLLKIPFPNNLKAIDYKDIEGCYLYGANGVGKTLKACFMQVSYINSSRIKKTKFISTVELLFQFKNCYSTKFPEKTDIELMDYYSNLDLLVLDDFGVEKSSEWAYQMLYLLINRRYENMKKTIFTSNFSLEELGQRLGDDRIPSRIQAMGKVIKMKGIDYRCLQG